MDLLSILSVIKRHWFMMSLGVLIGLIAVSVVQYRFDSGGGVRRREIVKYEGTMQLVVVDPKFSIGRTSGQDPAADQFQKTIGLALTYGDLIVSDSIRAAASSASGVKDVTVTGEGVQDAPIVEVRLAGYDPDRVTAYAKALARSLDQYLRGQQDASGVPADQRMAVKVLSYPAPAAKGSRQWELAIVAFLAPVLLAFGIASVRDHRPRSVPVAERRTGAA